MRRKLLILAVSATLVGLVVAFALALPLMGQRYRDEVQHRLDAMLGLLYGELGQVTDRESAQRFIRDNLASLGDDQVRLTLLDQTGGVLYDSQGALEESHADRPEVSAALAGGRGYAQRRSESLGIDYLYAAAGDGRVALRIALPLDGVADTQWMLLGCAALGVGAGLIAACLAASLAGNRLVGSIDRLTRASQAIARGEWRVRVTPGRDELGELACAFNAMGDQLQSAVKALQVSTTRLQAVLQGLEDGVLVVDGLDRVVLCNQRAGELAGLPGLREGASLDQIASLQALQVLLRTAHLKRRALREQLLLPEGSTVAVYAAPLEGPGEQTGTLAVMTDVTRLRKLEQLRSDFVANVSHELKTPLTSIQGYVELLKSPNRDRQTQLRFCEIIEIEAERLSALIEDLLQLSEIEHGREEGVEACDLAEVADQIHTRLAPLAERMQVSLDVTPERPLPVRANAHRMRQLLSNLMENAIKYNHPGGRVGVTAWRQGEQVCLRVSDTGIGIPAEHHDRLFERFYRVDKSRSRQMGGTGLGLSIVKHIVQRYHGWIELESTVGEGTVFTVILPQDKHEERGIS